MVGKSVNPISTKQMNQRMVCRNDMREKREQIDETEDGVSSCIV